MNAPLALQVNIKARVGRLVLEVELETGPGPLIIIGPNGSGKTSLLSLILGVLPVESGYLQIGQNVILDTERGIDKPLEHRQLGYVPQDYALFPHLTVRENIAFAIASSKPQSMLPSSAQRVTELLSELSLSARGGQRIQTLSGGEKQRVALARALSVSPHALLLDEPLSALDVHSRREVRGFLAEYLQRLELPTLVVTHDAADAQQLGDRIAVLEDGRITQCGAWGELVARPATRFVEEFISSAMPPS